MGSLWQSEISGRGVRMEFADGLDAQYGCGYNNHGNGSGYLDDHFAEQRRQKLFGYVPVVSVETLLNNMVITGSVENG